MNSTRLTRIADVRRSNTAVFAPYGWPAELVGDAILERLLTLNTERGSGQ